MTTKLKDIKPAIDIKATEAEDSKPLSLSTGVRKRYFFTVDPKPTELQVDRAKEKKDL